METPAHPFPTLSSAAHAFRTGPVTAPGKWLTASAMRIPQAKSQDRNLPWQKKKFGRCLRFLRSSGVPEKILLSGWTLEHFNRDFPLCRCAARSHCKQALAGLAAQAPNEKPDRPMLLKLAEHVAIRFALDSYERGECA